MEAGLVREVVYQDSIRFPVQGSVLFPVGELPYKNDGGARRKF